MLQASLGGGFRWVISRTIFDGMSAHASHWLEIGQSGWNTTIEIVTTMFSLGCKHFFRFYLFFPIGSSVILS